MAIRPPGTAHSDPAVGGGLFTVTVPSAACASFVAS